MAIAAIQRPQPMSASARFRLATAISAAFHLVVILLVGFIAVGHPAEESMEPIEVSLVQAAAPEPPAAVAGTEAQPEASVMPGGGSPAAQVVSNPSPVKSPKPSTQPASNAGGKAKAAPGAPAILTSPNGKTPAGPVGKGSAPFGPGGQAEVPGGGPTYGPGVGGGPEPTYPKHALDQGLEGTVTLTVTVGANGEIASVDVASSSGHALLDQAAIRAVKQGWKFTPGLAKGKPMAGKVKVTFLFAAGVVRRG